MGTQNTNLKSFNPASANLPVLCGVFCLLWTGNSSACSTDRLLGAIVCGILNTLNALPFVLRGLQTLAASVFAHHDLADCLFRIGLLGEALLKALATIV